jgi:hypothetical protein
VHVWQTSGECFYVGGAQCWRRRLALAMYMLGNVWRVFGALLTDDNELLLCAWAVVEACNVQQSSLQTMQTMLLAVAPLTLQCIS